MTVENETQIDAMGIETATGKVVLTISDHLDWSHAPAHLQAIESKVNPFLHLRLGQVLFDAGDHERAADELARAYMGAEADLFADQDERYIAFLKTHMAI